MSSLSPKQVSEIKSLYESIYEPKQEESLIEEAIFEVTDDQIRESLRIDIDETLKEYGDTLTEEEYELVEEVLLEVVKKFKQSTSILNKILNCLEKIENGNCDQQEASFEVGSLLKQLYIDSALQNAKKLESNENIEKETIKVEPKNISWAEYKIKLKNNL